MSVLWHVEGGLQPLQPCVEACVCVYQPYKVGYRSPEVLCNITIKGIKIHMSGTAVVASGIIHRQITLLEGMDVTLIINHILPLPGREHKFRKCVLLASVHKLPVREHRPTNCK
jgi:hypothetical protein